MQMSQAASAGGAFFAGGVNAPSAENTSPQTPTATADFEQHMQQSCGDQAASAGPLVVSTMVGEAVDPVVVAPPSSTRAIPDPAPTGETQLVQLEITRAGLPRRLEEEALPVVDEPPSPAEGAASDPEIKAAERPEPDAMAAAALLMFAPVPVRVPIGKAESGAASGSGEVDAEPAEMGGSRCVVNGLASMVSAHGSTEASLSRESRPDLRRSMEADARHASGLARSPAGPAASVAPETSPAMAPKLVEMPQIRRPGHDVTTAPVQTGLTPDEVNSKTAEPGAARIQFGERRDVNVPSLRPPEGSRIPVGSEETTAVSSVMFRRANLIPPGGTAAAKLVHSMEERLKENQSAGTPEQKLPAPGRNAVAADVRPLAARAIDSVREVAMDRPDKGLNPLAEVLAGRPASASGRFAESAVGGVESSVGVNPVRTTEQVLQNLTREVAQFRRFNAESMAVVLKPDAQTEIFLHLVSRSGQIEIQARFERGDFASLNGQWAQLQQSLAQQGVRLSHLHEGFNQPSQQPGGGPEWGHGQMNQGQQRHSGRDTGERTPPPVFEELMRPDARAEVAPRPDRVRKTASFSRAALEAWA